MVDQEVAEQYALEQRVKSGSRWFYWIAGLSIINTVTAASDLHLNFPVGLGATQVVDAIVAQGSVFARAVGFSLDLLIAGIMVGMGVSSGKYSWVFIVGLTFYAADAIIFLVVKEWVGFGFHFLAGFGILAGYGASRKLGARRHASELKGMPPTPDAAAVSNEASVSVDGQTG